MERIYGTPNSPIGRNLLKERKRFPILTWVPGYLGTWPSNLGTWVPGYLGSGYLMTQDLLCKTEMAGMEGIAQGTKSFICCTRERDATSELSIQRSTFFMSRKSSTPFNRVLTDEQK